MCVCVFFFQLSMDVYEQQPQCPRAVLFFTGDNRLCLWSRPARQKEFIACRTNVLGTKSETRCCGTQIRRFALGRNGLRCILVDSRCISSSLQLFLFYGFRRTAEERMTYLTATLLYRRESRRKVPVQYPALKWNHTGVYVYIYTAMLSREAGSFLLRARVYTLCVYSVGLLCACTATTLTVNIRTAWSPY